MEFILCREFLIVYIVDIIIILNKLSKGIDFYIYNIIILTD
ncbi:MAG: hypothetical protein K0S30_1664 [Clostridia bacterium]|jgi:hypothetical protein|nr:hypothetical protein [Clostridia bacterium]